MYDFYKENSIPFPRTMIDVFHHFAGPRTLLNVHYLFHPESDGITQDYSASFNTSDWHVSNFNKDPAKVSYVAKLKAWGEEWHPAVKAGFEGKLDKYIASKPQQPPTPLAVGPTTNAVNPPSGTGVEGRLENLKSLLDKGLITPQEYDQKKAEILRGL